MVRFWIVCSHHPPRPSRAGAVLRSRCPAIPRCRGRALRDGGIGRRACLRGWSGASPPHVDHRPLIGGQPIIHDGGRRRCCRAVRPSCDKSASSRKASGAQAAGLALGAANRYASAAALWVRPRKPSPRLRRAPARIPSCATPADRTARPLSLETLALALISAACNRDRRAAAAAPAGGMDGLDQDSSRPRRRHFAPQNRPRAWIEAIRRASRAARSKTESRVCEAKYWPTSRLAASFTRVVESRHAVDRLQRLGVGQAGSGYWTSDLGGHRLEASCRSVRWLATRYVASAGLAAAQRWFSAAGGMSSALICSAASTGCSAPTRAIMWLVPYSDGAQLPERPAEAANAVRVPGPNPPRRNAS